MLLLNPRLFCDHLAADSTVQKKHIKRPARIDGASGRQEGKGE